jgi:VWFA-related protein
MRSPRGRFSLPACLAAGLSVALVAHQDPPQPPFRSGANTVAVYATVTDATGRLVPNLTREDFEVYDNGKLQPLTLFAAETQPISIAIMLDRSGSMKENFRLVNVGAEEFVRRLLPADKARIGTFAAKITLEPEEFTSDRKTLIDILRGEMQTEGPTPLWNAANTAMKALVEQDGRRVVLLFTDGVDSPMNFKTNNLSVMDVVDRATRDDMMVYAIGLESTMPYGRRQSPLPGGGGFGGGFGGQSGGGMTQRPDPGLPKIAEETGGGYFELTRADDLRTTFARVADELHQQYALGFEPTKLDGKRHELEIKIKTKGMKVRARKYYVAARPKPAGS